MTARAPSQDVFVEALRRDTPCEEDRERLRALLLASGVAVGTSVATGAVQYASASMTHSTGLWGKLLLLPAAAKVGVSTAALTLVTALTVGPQVWAPSPRSSPVAKAAAATATARPVAPVRESIVQVHPSAPSAPVPSVALESSAPAVQSQPLAASKKSRSRGLADEAVLLERSLRALTEGQTAHAQRLLRVYRQRYPQGALRVEAERAEEKLRAMHLGTEPSTKPRRPSPGVSHD